MTLVLIVGGVYGLTTILRYILEMFTNRAMTSLAKLAVATGVAFSMTISLMQGEEANVVAATALAGLGGATILHRLHRFLGALGDWYRLQVVQGSLRRQLP